VITSGIASSCVEEYDLIDSLAVHHHSYAIGTRIGRTLKQRHPNDLMVM